MPVRRIHLLYLVIAVIALAIAGFGWRAFGNGPTAKDKPAGATGQVEANPTETPSPASSTPEPEPAPTEPTAEELVAKWKHLGWIDAHYHGSVMSAAPGREADVRKTFGVESTVLFGEVSESFAIVHDDFSLKTSEEHPGEYYPFFSGIDLHDPQGVEAARERFEQGFYGMGEIAAASTYSPAVSNKEWKANDPMDGILPDLYALCGEMKAPILLHIDPPSGYPIAKLEEALEAYPDTTFIFGHGNAYNSATGLEPLLEQYPNLIVDVFAGFELYNPDGRGSFDEFVPLIKKYPDRFVVSTDSGYDIGYEKALEGAYRLFEAVGDEETNRKIARGNLAKLFREREAAMAAAKNRMT